MERLFVYDLLRGLFDGRLMVGFIHDRIHDCHMVLIFTSALGVPDHLQLQFGITLCYRIHAGIVSMPIGTCSLILSMLYEVAVLCVEQLDGRIASYLGAAFAVGAIASYYWSLDRRICTFDYIISQMCMRN
ncbi:hypothetical protein BVRB_032090 [Beta vulgaris subsp. vulgaris]|uniref:Uncharacterized protein n=1 Tax=Beta vulgaris subsp. vulgaris TaxID=3555 RepID=A0A0J8B0E4_BETVV|nr:hypothetical protein BVRB_032090 [Beta vulgaris subsp. vulgaris]